MALIAVDTRTNHNTGVARYGRAVTDAASAVAAQAGHRLAIIVRDGQENTYEHLTVHGHQVVPVPGDSGFVRDSEHLRRVLATMGADFFYASHYIVDRRCPVPYQFTIHDLNRWRFPELSYDNESFVARFGQGELSKIRSELTDLATPDEPAGEQTFTRYFKAVNLDLASRAARIAVVSNATASDVQTILGVPADRIDVVPCGVDDTTFRPRPDDVARVRREHGVGGGPYVMFVGLAHPNKRFSWLVDQLTAARETLPAGARLVVVGGHGERDEQAARIIARRGAEDFVVFTGRVTDLDLAALYTGAAAWVTASVNEGNNLPPLEAMACGTEVIATDIPPLRETLGGFAHFYRLEDAGQFQALVARALDGSLPSRSGEYRAPTWQDAGELLVASWERALAELS
ncbi:hypothetical protein GCM10027059_37740 [Myceligenerans halotolerans]